MDHGPTRTSQWGIHSLIPVCLNGTGPSGTSNIVVPDQTFEPRTQKYITDPNNSGSTTTPPELRTSVPTVTPRPLRVLGPHRYHLDRDSTRPSSCSSGPSDPDTLRRTVPFVRTSRVVSPEVHGRTSDPYNPGQNVTQNDSHPDHNLRLRLKSRVKGEVRDSLLVERGVRRLSIPYHFERKMGEIT